MAIRAAPTCAARDRVARRSRCTSRARIAIGLVSSHFLHVLRNRVQPRYMHAARASHAKRRAFGSRSRDQRRFFFADVLTARKSVIRFRENNGRNELSIAAANATHVIADVASGRAAAPTVSSAPPVSFHALASIIDAAAHAAQPLRTHIAIATSRLARGRSASGPTPAARTRLGSSRTVQ